MDKKPVGRPRKDDVTKPATKEELKKEQRRKYMRDYRARIEKDIAELDKKEGECQKELEEVRNEKRI